MKHEWRKQEKNIYLPKKKPEIIEVPEMNYFMIMGEGNPNEPAFAECIGVLYSLAYAVRMSYKSETPPEGYYEYTVYPLEGVWDLTEKGKADYNGTLDKDQLAFELMIRQPEFVTSEFAAEIIDRTKQKKPHPLLEEARFVSIAEGRCIQMMHLGPYDDEPASFQEMEAFCTLSGLRRSSRRHREIYLSDARKTAPEKLKTVLRFKAK